MIALGVAVVILIAVYFGLRSSVTESGRLLPFQMLVRDLVSADQAMFTTLKQSLLDAEAVRASAGRWPEAAAVTTLPRNVPGAETVGSSEGFTWRTLR